MPTYRLLLEKVNLSGHYVSWRINDQEAKILNEKIKYLNDEWKNLITLVNDLKEK